MLIVGLTGSIGMGKTTVARMFADRDVPVFDADAEVHRLYEGAAVAPLRRAFPDVVRDGRVDRPALAKALAADPLALARLEAIVHPLVEAAEHAFVRAAYRGGGHAFVLMEIPLLFEAGRDKSMDATIVVSAPVAVQRARVLARPGMTPEKLDLILARQLSDAEKRTRADFVVDTGIAPAETEQQVARLLTELASRDCRALALYLGADHERA